MHESDFKLQYFDRNNTERLVDFLLRRHIGDDKRTKTNPLIVNELGLVKVPSSSFSYSYSNRRHSIRQYRNDGSEV